MLFFHPSFHSQSIVIDFEIITRSRGLNLRSRCMCDETESILKKEMILLSNQNRGELLHMHKPLEIRSLSEHIHGSNYESILNINPPKPRGLVVGLSRVEFCLLLKAEQRTGSSIIISYFYGSNDSSPFGCFLWDHCDSS
jgi:hypothetical protein